MDYPANIFQASFKNVNFGERVTVIQPSNLYGCSIGDGSFVGPFVEIQANVTIGKNTKIQSHSFICEYVSIGDNSFIGHGVIFVNDLMQSGRPAYAKPEEWRKCSVGNNVSIGSNATILPVSICDNCLIGAGAVVTKDILIPGVYLGNPARFHRAL